MRPVSSEFIHSPVSWHQDEHPSPRKAKSNGVPLDMPGAAAAATAFQSAVPASVASRGYQAMVIATIVLAILAIWTLVYVAPPPVQAACVVNVLAVASA